jgi:hypothetical protein
MVVKELSLQSHLIASGLGQKGGRPMSWATGRATVELIAR